MYIRLYRFYINNYLPVQTLASTFFYRLFIVHSTLLHIITQTTQEMLLYFCYKIFCFMFCRFYGFLSTVAITLSANSVFTCRLRKSIKEEVNLQTRLFAVKTSAFVTIRKKILWHSYMDIGNEILVIRCDIERQWKRYRRRRQ